MLHPLVESLFSLWINDDPPVMGDLGLLCRAACNSKFLDVFVSQIENLNG